MKRRSLAGTGPRRTLVLTPADGSALQPVLTRDAARVLNVGARVVAELSREPSSAAPRAPCRCRRPRRRTARRRRTRAR